MPLPVLPVLVVGSLVLFAGMKPKPKKTGQTRPAPSPEPTPELEEAVVYCQTQGGEVVDYETVDGEIVAVCTFPDGRMAEVLPYYRGEAAPDCPVGMVFDQTLGECVIPGGPDFPDSPEEALEFVTCTSLYTQAWRPWAPESGFLDPAVAANLALILYNQAKTAQTNNKGYSRPESLADVGMVHVSPTCDWFAYMAEVDFYVDQGQGLPMTNEEADKLDQVYETVVGIASDVLGQLALEDLESMEEPQAQGGMIPGQQQPKPSGGMAPGNQQKLCPVGYFYDALHDVCCPDGFYWNVDEQTCRPFGYAGARRKRTDAIRNPGLYGYAGGCGSRRGHCGVRPRS